MLQTNSKYEVNSVFNRILFPTHGKLPAKKNIAFLLISVLFNFRGKLTVQAQIQQKVKLFFT
jgi:hypothetical protein